MRRHIIFTIALLTAALTMAALIYEEVLKRHQPDYGPLPPRFWNDESQLPVDLARFFNNDGVATDATPYDANFDCPDHPPDLPGSGYPAAHLPPGGLVARLQPSGTLFLFPVLAAGEPNNVSARGQRIAVMPQARASNGGFACTELVVIGSAENGPAQAELAVEYADGPAARVPLAFPDWCAPLAPGEETAASAPFRYAWDPKKLTNTKEDIPCHLYVRRLPLDPARRVTGFVLPETPNLHVFAMTLRLAAADNALVRAADGLALKYRDVARLATAPQAEVEEPLAELAQALDDAEARIDPALRRRLVWLQAQHDYLVWRLGARITRQGSVTESWAQNTIRDIRSDLDELLGGTDPFRLRRGHLVKGYVSEIDGAIQPYAVYVPETYRESVPAPLVVHMHGHGWYRPFQCIPTYPFRDAVVVSPQGRGSMDYMFVGEEDVLACIEEATKDYRIDLDRVYLLGGSMGGTGCWSLATKYPDRFAAVGPTCANADSKAWWGVTGKRTPDAGSCEWLRAFLRDSLDPVTYAGNLLGVRAYFLHGNRDSVVPVENSRSMAKALADSGCDFVYREGEGAGHGWYPADIVAQQHDFIFASRREPSPPRVRLKAAYLKYAHAYWFRILRFERFSFFGEAEAEVRGRSAIRLTLQNVEAFEIDLTRCPVDRAKALTVIINDQVPFADMPPADGRLTMAKVGGEWRSVPPPSGLRKTPYLEGPVSDAFTRSFLIVVGTQGKKALDRRTVREEAQRFADDWELLYTKPPRMKTDREVTADDIARHNLILYGGPDDNEVTARIAGRLPIQIRGGAVTLQGRVYDGPGVAVKFCYPNPLNAERLVVVIAGAHGGCDLFQSNNLFGNWLQWAAFENRAWFDFAVFDRRSHSAETCLEFGFFGSDWQFRRDTTWFGDAKERESAPARQIPELARPPEGRNTVYLSELIPVRIEQHRMPVGFDTSAEGRRLTAGAPPKTKVFSHGLGVRPASTVAFDVNAADAPKPERFTRFRATVGIDLEGQTAVPPWRDKDEWVNFLVYGDGRLLYQTGSMKWNTAPRDIDVPIGHVQEFELEVWCSWARWLVGSAAWGDARIVRGDLPHGN